MDQSSQPSDVVGPSPFDTAMSAATRFGIELVAWIAGPWAAYDIVGSWWALVGVAIVLVGLPAVFNTPGDKQATGVPTPGALRIAIEMFLLVVAVVGAARVWPGWALGLVVVLGAVMLVSGSPRYRWLAGRSIRS